jgi:alpha-tubulin suppressor-like RCC1 family protein
VLTTAGGVKCWGLNHYGQLGDGTNTSTDVPVDVSGLTSGVNLISSFFYHTCALTTAGGVKCWGGNEYGQLGDGTNTDSNVPVNVSGLASGVTALNVSGNNTGNNIGNYHVCVLTAVGGVKCWGDNSFGSLGNGTNTNSNVPVDVTGLTSGVAAVSAGEDSSCALTSAGGVKCWGNNANGELGNGTNTASNVPVDVAF